MIGHFFQKTFYIKITFMLEYACQREIPARAQSDFMLFLSAYARPKKGWEIWLCNGPHIGRFCRQEASNHRATPLPPAPSKLIHYEWCDSNRERSDRVDATASVHTVCVLEFVVLCCVLLSDTRCTDSDRKWSWHWLRVQARSRELQDKQPLLMSWLQQAIIVHVVMRGIHLWRLFIHLGDHWAPEAVLEDFNFCLLTVKKAATPNVMSHSSGTLCTPHSLKEQPGFGNQVPWSALLKEDLFSPLTAPSKFMLMKEL